jgi:hypothetical protein
VSQGLVVGAGKRLREDVGLDGIDGIDGIDGKDLVAGRDTVNTDRSVRRRGVTAGVRVDQSIVSTPLDGRAGSVTISNVNLNGPKVRLPRRARVIDLMEKLRTGKAA